MDNTNIISRLLGLFKVKANLDELLISCQNGDGIIREDAVKKLALQANPKAIPALIVRLNDWVPQIRSAAKDAILTLATSENTRDFIEHLPEIYHLRKCRRGNHEDIIRKINQCLLSKENRFYIVAGINNENRLIARICYALASAHGLLPAESLVETGLSNPDIIIRQQASILLEDLGPDTQAPLLATALKDKHMPIRRAALQLKLNLGQENHWIESYLFDRHSAIREIAVNKLLTRDVNVLGIYQSALTCSSPLKTQCAIWGIGFLSCENSLAVLIKLLNSPLPSIRKQTLCTLLSLRSSWLNAHIHTLLSDSSPVVGRKAASICYQLGIHLDAELLINIIKLSPYEHTQNIIFSMIKKINKWERLIFLLKIRSDIKPPEAVEMQRMTAEIFHWNADFNKSGCQPTENQLELLQRVYAQQRQYNDHNLSRIMSTIKVFVSA